MSLQSENSDKKPKYGLILSIFVIIAAPPHPASADPKKGPAPQIPRAKGSFSLVKYADSTTRAIGPNAASPTPTPILKIIKSQNCCAIPQRPVKTLHIIIAKISTFFRYGVSASLPNIRVAIPKNIAKTVPNRKPI